MAQATPYYGNVLTAQQQRELENSRRWNNIMSMMKTFDTDTLLGYGLGKLLSKGIGTWFDNYQQRGREKDEQQNGMGLINGQEVAPTGKTMDGTSTYNIAGTEFTPAEIDQIGRGRTAADVENARTMPGLLNTQTTATGSNANWNGADKQAYNAGMDYLLGLTPTENREAEYWRYALGGGR